MSNYGDGKPAVKRSNPFLSQKPITDEIGEKGDHGEIYFKDDTGAYVLLNLKWERFPAFDSAEFLDTGTLESVTDANGKLYSMDIMFVKYPKSKKDEKVGVILTVVPNDKRIADMVKEPTQKKTAKKSTAKKPANKITKSTTKKTAKGAKKSVAKRPLNAYMRFAVDERKKVVKENPKMCITDVARELGTRYKKLSDAQKDKYKALAIKEFSA